MEYPNLYALLTILAGDNGVTLKYEVDCKWPDESNLYESQARVIPGELREEFVCGDYDEKEKLVNHHTIRQLDLFLDEAFDVKFNDFFLT